MPAGPKRLRRTLALCEHALLVVGGVCLVAYGLACARTSYVQSREAEAFDTLRARVTVEEPDRSEWSAQRVAAWERARTGEAAALSALARLEIPDAGVSVMVLAGTEDETLDLAVGHIEGTPRPGEAGNVGIAGHRDGFFRGLRKLEVGDRLSLTHLGGVVEYEVETLRIVEPTAVEVLAPTEGDALTLVTCYPFYFVGDAPQRYIVRARPRSGPTFQHAAN